MRRRRWRLFAGSAGAAAVCAVSLAVPGQPVPAPSPGAAPPACPGPSGQRPVYLDTLNLTGANPWLTPDTDQAREQPHAPAAGVIEAVNNDQSFVDLAHARVRYASGNPRVATVSPAGLLTAVGSGTTTIGVTINGVTGSAVVVVR